MRRILFLAAIGLLFTFKLEAKRIDGQIVFADKTVDVVFNIPVGLVSGEPNFQRLQSRVKYFDSAGKKKTLRPDDALEFRFYYGGEEIRMLSRRNTMGFSISSNIFLRLKMDGKLKLFHYYYSQSSPGMYNAGTGGFTGGYTYSVENFLLQKGDGELKRPRRLTFKRDMAEYFGDCPDLVDKIQSKDFRKDDLESIVSFYNFNCR